LLKLNDDDDDDAGRICHKILPARDCISTSV